MNYKITTELPNKRTKDIDKADSLTITKLINTEDKTVAKAIEASLKDIAQGIDAISSSFTSEGRLLYFGAGTSGRLGVLDASECVPTFGVSPNMVMGFIAGGDRALRISVEGAEDSISFANKDLKKANISKKDTVVCISAYGNAKYVLHIMQKAKEIGAKTISLTANKQAKINEYADIVICVATGEEVITGSTRMKAGSAQKMVLNMLSTGAMIKIGKTYKNLMVDVKPLNKKLKIRSIKIVSEVAKCTEDKAKATLTENNYQVKNSILMIKYGISFEDSEKELKKAEGILAKAMENLSKI